MPDRSLALTEALLGLHEAGPRNFRCNGRAAKALSVFTFLGFGVLVSRMSCIRGAGGNFKTVQQLFARPPPSIQGALVPSLCRGCAGCPRALRRATSARRLVDCCNSCERTASAPLTAPATSALPVATAALAAGVRGWSDAAQIRNAAAAAVALREREQTITEAPAATSYFAPVVLAGPSGVGKGTIVKELVRRYPLSFGFSVSHTTRQPRPGEVDGKHYHFSTWEGMQHEIEMGRFIEFARVHDNMYGTSKASVEAIAAQHKICLLDIDVQGVRKIKQADLSPSPRYVFIMPPTWEALETRLRGRDTESEENLQTRLSNAKAEIAYAEDRDGGNFDLVLVNDDLNAAVSQLVDAIEGWTGMHLK